MTLPPPSTFTYAFPQLPPPQFAVLNDLLRFFGAMPPPPVRPPIAGKWFHGGPHIDGDELLPANVTGHRRPETDRYAKFWPTIGTRFDYVHITDDPRTALMYAMEAGDAWLFEVEPVGTLELDPDYVPNADVQECRCPTARIVGRCPARPVWDEYHRLMADA